MPASPNRLTRVILVGSTLLAGAVDAAETGLHFKSYDPTQELLRMGLVTPSTHGDFLLGQGGKTRRVDGAVLENLFTLKVQVPCDQLTSATRAFWALPNQPLLSADIPAQRCQQPPLFPPVHVFNDKGTCWLNSNGNTLWRTALEYSRLNHASVYQNMYALFLANRSAFAKEDIYRLTTPLLRCPTDQQLAEIDPDHARSLFAEADQFHHARAQPAPHMPARAQHEATPPANPASGQSEQAKVNSPSAPLPVKGAPLNQTAALTPTPPVTQPGAPARVDRCMIDTQGATLWHTADTYRQQHGVTVYQAIYALYQANPHGFAHGDITRLTARLLHCPDPAELSQRSPKQARQWYRARVNR